MGQIGAAPAMGNETSSRHVVKIGRLVLVAAMAGAWTAAHAAAWIDVGRITHVIVEGEDDGRRVYLAVENSPNPDSCANQRARAPGRHGTPKLTAQFVVAYSASSQTRSILIDFYGRHGSE